MLLTPEIPAIITSPLHSPAQYFRYINNTKFWTVMETYLLLRSNKQSGPYSLDQLISFGLKPYDLVWIEGKSAAWRYPSEVDGLKNFAPAVEEQPYDRFFKKPSEEPKTEVVVKEAQKTETLITKNITPKIEHEPVTSTRKVFVSMPGKSVPQPIAPSPVAVKSRIVKEEKKIPIVPEVKTTEPSLNEKFARTEIPADLNENYSESLDEIKKRYTETYLSRKKKSKWTSTHTAIVQVVGGAIFFCFLVVLAYKNFSGEEKPEEPRVVRIKPKQPTTETTNTALNTPIVLPPATSTINNSYTEKENIQPNTIALQTQKPTVQKNVEQNDIAESDPPVQQVEKKPEHKAIMPVLEEIKKEEPRKTSSAVNINSLVNVKANKYKQRPFGGVQDLELTVNNRSAYKLDKVVVELQYLKPSEQPLKTEKIVFNAVSPNGSQTFKVPDYTRGVMIAYKITGIESSQYESSTAGL